MCMYIVYAIMHIIMEYWSMKRNEELHDNN